MRDVLVALTGAIVSGLFSIISVLIPYYLEKGKTREEIRRDFESKNYYHNSLWHLLFSVSLPLLCYFAIAIIALFYGTQSYIIIAEQMPNGSEFFSTFNLYKSPQSVWWTSLLEIFLVAGLMFIALLFCLKYLAHRTGNKAGIYVSLSVAIVLAIENVLWIVFLGRFRELVVINMLVKFVVYSTAGFFALKWARKTRDEFVISHVLSKLTSQDRIALRDLVRDS
jgi:MFS family permease